MIGVEEGVKRGITTHCHGSDDHYVSILMVA